MSTRFSLPQVSIVLPLALLVQILLYPDFTYAGPRRTANPTVPSQNAVGNFFYVDPNGDDANPGTSTQPWKTIQKAADTLMPGDSAIVLPGTYNERVQITKSGTSGAPITFQANGTVVMQGFTIKASYITLISFEITNTPDDPVDGMGIAVLGSNCIIENNYIHYATRGGILLYTVPGNETGTSNCIVRNNRLYRNAMNGIDVRGRNHLIEGNEIWGTIQYHPNWINPPSWVDADGIHFHGSGHILRKNYIHDIKYGVPENINPHIDCFQTFQSLPYEEAASNVLLEQNTCFSVSSQFPDLTTHGFMIHDADHLTVRNNIVKTYSGAQVNGSNNIYLVNNTFVGDLAVSTAYNPAGIDMGGTLSSAIENNLFYNPPGNVIYLDSTSQQGLSAGRNLAYRDDGKPLWTTSTYSHPNDLWGIDPLLVNPAANDFHLQPNSPARDAGMTPNNVPNDFDGNFRPQGGGFDIGAYELPALRKRATPNIARIGNLVTFTISFVANGNPTTITDTLPVQFTYLSSNPGCGNTVNYDSSTRQITYSITPPAGSSCTLQISTRVNTGQPMAVTNTVMIDNGLISSQSASVIVILNGFNAFIPAILKSK